MPYREDELNQALFAAMMLRDVRATKSSARESMRTRAQADHGLADRFIAETVRDVTDELQNILAEGDWRDDIDIDAYCRDTLRLPIGIRRLAETLPDNPRLLAQATMAWRTFHQT